MAKTRTRVGEVIMKQADFLILARLVGSLGSCELDSRKDRSIIPGSISRKIKRKEKGQNKRKTERKRKKKKDTLQRKTNFSTPHKPAVLTLKEYTKIRILTGGRLGARRIFQYRSTSFFSKGNITGIGGWGF